MLRKSFVLSALMSAMFLSSAAEAGRDPDAPTSGAKSNTVAPTEGIHFSRNYVPYGGGVMVTWNHTTKYPNVTCQVSGLPFADSKQAGGVVSSNTMNVGTSGSRSFYAYSNVSARFTCSDGYSASAYLEVGPKPQPDPEPAPKPIVNLISAVNSIPYPQSVYFTIMTQNAESCSLNNFPAPINGGQYVYFDRSGYATLGCSGPGGWAIDMHYITVGGFAAKQSSKSVQQVNQVDLNSDGLMDTITVDTKTGMGKIEFGGNAYPEKLIGGLYDMTQLKRVALQDGQIKVSIEK